MKVLTEVLELFLRRKREMRGHVLTQAVQPLTAENGSGHDIRVVR